MERNEMIILGAVAVVAFVLLRKPAAIKPGPGTTGGASVANAGPNAPQQGRLEAQWPYANSDWKAPTGPYLGHLAPGDNSPTQDPIAATGGAVPMPKIPLVWTP